MDNAVLFFVLVLLWKVCLYRVNNMKKRLIESVLSVFEYMCNQYANAIHILHIIFYENFNLHMFCLSLYTSYRILVQFGNIESKNNITETFEKSIGVSIDTWLYEVYILFIDKLNDNKEFDKLSILLPEYEYINEYCDNLIYIIPHFNTYQINKLSLYCTYVYADTTFYSKQVCFYKNASNSIFTNYGFAANPRPIEDTSNLYK